MLYIVESLCEMKRFMFSLSTSEDLLASIQDKIKWADNMGEVDSSNRKQVEERVEEVKKSRSMKVPVDCG